MVSANPSSMYRFQARCSSTVLMHDINACIGSIMYMCMSYYVYVHIHYSMHIYIIACTCACTYYIKAYTYLSGIPPFEVFSQGRGVPGGSQGRSRSSGRARGGLRQGSGRARTGLGCTSGVRGGKKRPQDFSLSSPLGKVCFLQRLD